jgi:hypothetical protein
MPTSFHFDAILECCTSSFHQYLLSRLFWFGTAKGGILPIGFGMNETKAAAEQERSLPVVEAKTNKLKRAKGFYGRF